MNNEYPDLYEVKNKYSIMFLEDAKDILPTSSLDTKQAVEHYFTLILENAREDKILLQYDEIVMRAKNEEKIKQVLDFYKDKKDLNKFSRKTIRNHIS